MHANLEAIDTASSLLQSFSEHRRLLFGIAYRMLGSVAEAEDMVQEVWLRWQRLDSTQVRSPKAWLSSAMTRLCIDQMRSARRQREEYYGVWLPEPLAVPEDAGPGNPDDRADSLSMAFMFMLERLGAVERAVFLLREVFDCEYAEVAEAVGKTEANCRQIVRRAKAQLLAEPKPATTTTDHARSLVETFVRASATGDVKDLLALLATDAALYSDGGGRVQSVGRVIETADHISRFLVGIRERYPVDAEVRFVELNGEPAVLMLSQGIIFNAICFELAGDRVKSIFIMRNPDKLRHLAGVV